jgi:hypothetical protein
MLTLFTTAKPFKGESFVAQRNAICSWTKLHPQCEVILFGDEEGSAELAKESGIRHVQSVARSQSGTPLLNDLFEQAQRLALNSILAYVNADIILMRDLIDAVQRVASWRNRYLVTGRRTNLVIDKLLTFDLAWEGRMRELIELHGEPHPGPDYFVFPQNLWGEIPPFAVGREYWSSWLIYAARTRRAAVVDVSQVVLAVHQKHSYPPNRTEHPEWIQNRRLLGGNCNAFLTSESTHILTSQGIKQRCRSCYPVCVCQFDCI